MITDEFKELSIDDLVKDRIVTTDNKLYMIESEPGYARAEQHNTITCMAGGAEMLKVSDKGFWVRGIKVEQDDNEAQVVYNAFKAWMTWAQMTKDYK